MASFEDPSNTINSNRSRYLTSPGNIIRFPSSDIPYKMLINFKEYVYTNDISTASLISAPSNISMMDSGSIILPIPLQLNDSFQIEKEEISSAALAFGGSLINDRNFKLPGDISTLGLDDIQAYNSLISSTGILGVIGSLAAGNKSSLVATSGIRAIGDIAGSGQASLLTGKAVNPFQTVQFKGVNLKRHSFSWRLSPSSYQESIILKSIINKIKGNILPSYSKAIGPEQFGAHALLKYPGIAMASFHGIDQEFYYKLKPCMITSFVVKYNDGDQLNVYRGGKPVVVELSMDMLELSIHTSDDYGGPSYTDINNNEPDLADLQDLGQNISDAIFGSNDNSNG